MKREPVASVRRPPNAAGFSSLVEEEVLGPYSKVVFDACFVEHLREVLGALFAGDAVEHGTAVGDGGVGVHGGEVGGDGHAGVDENLHGLSAVAQDAAQCSIGLGGILSGLFVLAVGRRINVRLLVFPMLLVALVLLFFTLYLSVLVSEHAWVYLMFQGICYTTLFFSTLVASPAALTNKADRFIQTCAAYLSFRVGLSLGTIVLVIIPATVGGLFKTALTVALSIALVALCAVALLRCLKADPVDTDRSEQGGSEDSMEAACLKVSREYSLTPRETEVLFLLAKGRNAQHIAKALTLSPGTVKTHTAHIYQKTGVQSQQALMDLVDGSR